MKALSRIYLTGFMGSGKSTLGVLLAARLGYEFVDMDDQIEHAFGMRISQIFACHGEEAFRVAEVEVLHNTFRLERVVVAVGGGALANDHRMKEALQNGLVVYLSASEATLSTRLGLSESDRPLLKSGIDLHALLDQRRPTYETAHIILPVDNLGIHETLDALESAIQNEDRTGE
jgi:shikimate kinase